MHDRPGPLQLGEVRDCNRPALMAAIKGWGFQVMDYGIAKDKYILLSTPLRLSHLTSFLVDRDHWKSIYGMLCVMWTSL